MSKSKNNQLYWILVLFVALLFFWALKHYGHKLGIPTPNRWHGRMRNLILIVLTSLSTLSFGQSKIKSLIVVETDTNKMGEKHRNLVSYNFKKGNFISKDTLYTALDDKKIKYGRWFYYRDGSFIYKNRYAVGNGSVYDLKTNTLILDCGHDFVRIKADSIFFYQSFGDKEGLWALDLKTTRYVRLDSNIRHYDERRSPDQKHYILDDSKTDIKLYKSGDVAFTIIPATGAYYARYTRKRTEIHWLDNESFLYADHTNTFPPLPKPKPQPVLKTTPDTPTVYEFTVRDDAVTKATILKYNVKKKTSKKLAELDSVTHSVTRGRFMVDGFKQLIYISTNAVYHRLNLKNGKFTSYPYLILPNGFSIEIKQRSGGRILKYKEVEIGQVDSYSNTYTSNKFFASADYASLWIWNAYTRTPKRFEMLNGFQVVGWMDRLPLN
ncbi:hypothetical protein [Pedobacter frigoris]|uniref:hypothetical protein n=1 Tax=Pedobacter frigoris TaxID=2571272 RepID=UPI00292F456F|nr:hypothetical protein [Pedobacter frigoris]